MNLLYNVISYYVIEPLRLHRVSFHTSKSKYNSIIYYLYIIHVDVILRIKDVY